MPPTEVVRRTVALPADSAAMFGKKGLGATMQGKFACNTKTKLLPSGRGALVCSRKTRRRWTIENHETMP
jgi:hypothetical protein